MLLRIDSTVVKISVIYTHAAFKMRAGGELLAVRGEQVSLMSTASLRSPSQP